MRNILLNVLFAWIAIFPIHAQNVKRPDSYNYSRGVEAYRNNKIEEALDYLNKEISENPENGYAYL